MGGIKLTDFLSKFLFNFAFPALLHSEPNSTFSSYFYFGDFKQDSFIVPGDFYIEKDKKSYWGLSTKKAINVSQLLQQNQQVNQQIDLSSQQIDLSSVQKQQTISTGRNSSMFDDESAFLSVFLACACYFSYEAKKVSLYPFVDLLRSILGDDSSYEKRIYSDRRFVTEKYNLGRLIFKESFPNPSFINFLNSSESIIYQEMKRNINFGGGREVKDPSYEGICRGLVCKSLLRIRSRVLYSYYGRRGDFYKENVRDTILINAIGSAFKEKKVLDLIETFCTGVIRKQVVEDGFSYVLSKLPDKVSNPAGKGPRILYTNKNLHLLVNNYFGRYNYIRDVYFYLGGFLHKQEAEAPQVSLLPYDEELGDLSLVKGIILHHIYISGGAAVFSSIVFYIRDTTIRMLKCENANVSALLHKFKQEIKAFVVFLINEKEKWSSNKQRCLAIDAFLAIACILKLDIPVYYNVAYTRDIASEIIPLSTLYLKNPRHFKDQMPFSEIKDVCAKKIQVFVKGSKSSSEKQSCAELQEKISKDDTKGTMDEIKEIFKSKNDVNGGIEISLNFRNLLFEILVMLNNSTEVRKEIDQKKEAYHAQQQAQKQQVILAGGGQSINVNQDLIALLQKYNFFYSNVMQTEADVLGKISVFIRYELLTALFDKDCANRSKYTIGSRNAIRKKAKEVKEPVRVSYKNNRLIDRDILEGNKKYDSVLKLFFDKNKREEYNEEGIEILMYGHMEIERKSKEQSRSAQLPPHLSDLFFANEFRLALKEQSKSLLKSESQPSQQIQQIQQNLQNQQIQQNLQENYKRFVGIYQKLKDGLHITFSTDKTQRDFSTFFLYYCYNSEKGLFSSNEQQMISSQKDSLNKSNENWVPIGDDPYANKANKKL